MRGIGSSVWVMLKNESCAARLLLYLARDAASRPMVILGIGIVGRVWCVVQVWRLITSCGQDKSAIAVSAPRK